MSLVMWTAQRHMYETPWPNLHEVPVIPLAALAEVVEGLRVIGMETYCDGPGCGWCESDNRHPFTENAKEAQRLLAMLGAHKKEG